MKLSSPWPDGYQINPNGGYGMRRHPISGRIAKHRGVDVGGKYPVTAAGPGVISHIGWSPTGGGHVVGINHGKIYTYYYHGAHRTNLKKNQRVNTGDFIYTSGTTGSSTGNHLHFEVRTGKLGQWGTDTDPTPYLNGNVAVPVVKVSGRLDKATWTAWQNDLQAKGLYKGRIDGIPGPMTYRAIQGWAGVTADGIIGPVTRKAVQRKLGVLDDGLWGRLTITALQRALNSGGL